MTTPEGVTPETLITSYTFNPFERTITFAGPVPANLAAIYDTTLNTTNFPDIVAAGPYGTPLYLAEQAYTATISGNVLTLPVGSIPMRAKATDTLRISCFPTS